ncbi:hypothetical protein [Xanthomarina sp.]|uniref:hypothetical protein n=1 Tax=Xanthomarina sp. TaxID=1931211 RepID=UPI002C319932|nr:hypothetical protein [Xanthomarina sp.]HLV38000.1 hypothetical protein [Xanthomarina sp.]
MKTISKHFKTFQKSISKSKYVLLAFLVAFSVSCSTEDGEDGATGPAGTDGVDGTDGNANVQTFVFDTSSQSGSIMSFPIAEITQDVLDNDVILSYNSSNGFYYPMPGPGNAATYITRVYIKVGIFSFDINDWNGNYYSIAAGDIDEVKVVIIESSSTTSGRTAQGKQQIYNELNQAGVDINNYHAVCDYYGIPY